MLATGLQERCNPVITYVQLALSPAALYSGVRCFFAVVPRVSSPGRDFFWLSSPRCVSCFAVIAGAPFAFAVVAGARCLFAVVAGSFLNLGPF